MTSQLPRIQKNLSKFSVSVLPDFFADRILYVPSIDKLFQDIKQKAVSGGGSLRGYAQKEIKGGNATNLAFALARLGLAANLFIIGDRMTRGFTTYHPKNCKVKVIRGKPGYTLAIEFPFGGKRVNVMVSDVGDLSEFSGNSLSGADLRVIADSDCVAIVNWSSNSEGNKLTQMIFSLPRKSERLNFLDPADLKGAEDRIKILINRIIRRGLVDILSVNENESRILSTLLSVYKLPLDYASDDVRKTAMSIHEATGIKVDIHTPRGAASAIDRETFWVDSLGRAEGIVTGAGDVWDAGDIAGYLLNMEPESRLKFANACAHLYLSNKDAAPPTLQQVLEFVDKKGITF